MTQRKIAEELNKGATRSIITIAAAILEEARTLNASDIHIDPGAAGTSIRLRIDGLLEAPYYVPADCHAELIARLKILAGLRTDEHYAAQDGRFTVIPDAGSDYGVRLSIMPTYYGENAVLRLLTLQSHDRTLASLGMNEEHEKITARALAQPHGLILITGPTGSGKTTTLYAFMRMLARTPVSLVSIEDPIEYSLEGVTQVQVQPRAGLTFSNGLRALLRQDPDVIMVGEIRDAETAHLALTAALTGHLVFSTLHTNGALASLSRLSEMGMEPHLIAATMQLIVAQRLVRKTCSACIQEHAFTSREKDELCAEIGDGVCIPQAHFKGIGCARCGGTGYQGRTSLFEMLPISPIMRDALAARSPIRYEDAGMPTLIHDGLEKVRLGLTTLEELARIRHV